jgi:hypothetical protein
MSFCFRWNVKFNCLLWDVQKWKMKCVWKGSRYACSRHFRNKEFDARFEVLSVVIMKIIVFFGCDAVYVVDRYWRFRVTCCHCLYIVVEDILIHKMETIGFSTMSVLVHHVHDVTFGKTVNVFEFHILNFWRALLGTGETSGVVPTQKLETNTSFFWRNFMEGYEKMRSWYYRSEYFWK